VASLLPLLQAFSCAVPLGLSADVPSKHQGANADPLKPRNVHQRSARQYPRSRGRSSQIHTVLPTARPLGWLVLLSRVYCT